MKPIVYIDMDNVLVDFKSGIARIDTSLAAAYEGRLDEVPDIFSKMDPMPGALEAVRTLSNTHELYILSTAPWLNPSAWIHKLEWVQRYFGKEEGSLFYKRLILSHNKNLNLGEYLIDDRPHNGAEHFKGEWIHYGSNLYPDWQSVTEYLLSSLKS
jgi:5'-nucleotidase